MIDFLPETRSLLNAAYRAGVALDRKFEATDMTPELRQAAVAYAATYTPRAEGDDFMRDMNLRANSLAFLSDGQSKGVLNVMMADAKRRIAQRKNVAVQSTPSAPARVHLAVTPDGRYRVALSADDSIALKIAEAGKDSRFAGSRIVSTRINGDEWMGVAHITADGELKLWRSCSGSLRDRVRAAIDVLDDGTTEDRWLVAGLAFAQEGGSCFICGRDLDTQESLTAGYGPICAEKLGLPWGAKAVPMSVRLAQAAAPIEGCVGSVGPVAAEAATVSTATSATTSEVPTSTQEAGEPAETVAFRKGYYASKAIATAEGRARTYAEIFQED